jgi:acyl-CoA reductase-like NAD-dependent aldehyde dehydrogenase
MTISVVGAHWIDGEWIPSAGATKFQAVSPVDGAVIGSVPEGGQAAAEAAIAAARRTFFQSQWA